CSGSDAPTGMLVPTSAAGLASLSGGQWHIDPAGQVLTTIGQDYRVRRWDLTTNREIPLAPGYHKAVRVAFTADRSRLVVGDGLGTIDVYDPRTGRLLHALPR